MASTFDSLEKIPVWQRLLLWLLIAVAIVAAWYYLFYLDAVTARESAEAGVEKAKTELVRVQERKKKHLDDLREHEERKAKILADREFLPTSSTAVDNLMQIFQQKARQVGLSFDRWTNESEQRQDVYARLPVKVSARGTWGQLGEFFRQVAELKQMVSIENIKLTADQSARKDEVIDHPELAIEFEAATYRALSDEERNAPATAAGQKPSRRTGAGK